LRLQLKKRVEKFKNDFRLVLGGQMAKRRKMADITQLKPDIQDFAYAFIEAQGDTLRAFDATYPDRVIQLGNQERRRQAHALAQRAAVKKEVARIREELHADFVIGQQEALRILSDLARADLSTALNDDGSLDPIKVKALGRALQTVTCKETPAGNEITVKMHDPKAAIAQIASQMAWNQPVRHEIEEKVTFELNLGGPVIDAPNKACFPAQIEKGD